MKSNKVVFWVGLSIIILNLYGHNVGINLKGGDMYLMVGLATIMLSACFELIALFSIMAAFFVHQVIGADYALVTMGLGVLALSSAVVMFIRKG